MHRLRQVHKPLTLTDLVGGERTYQIVVWCDHCLKKTAVDPATLIEPFGGHQRVFSLHHRLRCQHCKSKPGRVAVDARA